MASSKGYAQIVHIMSQHQELAIFRKFGQLSIQSLLFMQAEITYLEQSLDLLLKNQQEEGEDRPFRSRDWWSMTQPDGNGNTEHWDKVQQIREKLEKYHDQLYKHIFLAKCQPPDSYDLNFFRDWLEGPTMGNFPLRGPDRHAWSPAHEKDLIAIQRRETGDPSSKWFINAIIPWFHRTFGFRIKKPLDTESQSPITHYSETPIHTLVSLISIVAACLLPISSILVLYFITNMKARLIVSLLFTASFALCLALVTRARRVEIFMATTAFAAVIVVFISGNGSQVS